MFPRLLLLLLFFSFVRMEYFQRSPSSSLSLSSTSSSFSFFSSASSSSSSSSHPLLIDDELWMLAEQRTNEILSVIQPIVVSEQTRQNIVAYFQRIIKGYYGIEVFPFGSVPLKTFLPDGDIDLTALSHQHMEEDLATYICSVLQDDHQKSPEFLVKDVQYIRAQVKIVKCTVNDIPVDISFNQMAGLSALCFLEKVDRFIGNNHLFKRSIVLIKAWCYYESRILGAHHGLISTYALETMILYIINVFHSSLRGPLEVLYRFLDYYSTFDWTNYCITITGPVSISSLAAVVSETPETDGDELVLNRDFLSRCRKRYSAPMQSLEIGANVFPVKYLNIVDPLKEHNNLGRSVSKGNFHRIQCALTYGAKRLGEILMLPGENLGMGLAKFFVNTLDRNGRGERPDVHIPVHAFGSGKSEVSDLKGDYHCYYHCLLYSQWYALSVPSHPTTVSSPSSLAWDSIRRLVRLRKGTDVFLPRFPFSHPCALRLPAGTYGIANMTRSRGTGTYIPDVNHQSYRERQTSISTRNHDCHEFDLSKEQFPRLPGAERTTTTQQSSPRALKSPTGNNSQPPVLTESRLRIPSIEKQKQKALCELKRDIVEPFQLKDNKDFPPLAST